MGKCTNLRGEQKGDDFNSDVSGRGLARWCSSTLAWDWIGRAFVSKQAKIAQVSFSLLFNTVGAKRITCAKSITRYGLNISKFFNFFFFFFYCLFIWKYVMIDTKRLFVYCHFFPPPIFCHCSTFRGANLLLKRAYIPKTTSPFLGGVVGNFFEDIFVLSVKISPRYIHPVPKV